jgi:hypothetical protein
MRRVVCGGLVLCALAYSLCGARADESAAKAIIENGIKATGGAEKIGKNKALTWKGKGTVNIMGNANEFTGEWVIHPPKQMKSQIQLNLAGNDTTIITILDGDKGWISFAGNVMDLQDEQLANNKEEMYSGRVATLLVLLEEPGYKLTTLGDSKVGDRPAVGVKVSHEGHKDISLFFDKDSGLLIKHSRRAKDFAGEEAEQEAFLSDYQDFDGVKRYKKMKIKRDGNDFIDMQVLEYKALEKLPDTTFAKPGQ